MFGTGVMFECGEDKGWYVKAFESQELPGKVVVEVRYADGESDAYQVRLTHWQAGKLGETLLDMAEVEAVK